MPIEFPTYRTIVDRSRADVSTALPGLDPTLRNSLIDALITADAGRAKDVYDDMLRLLREVFPQTASADFLDLHGEIFGVTRLPASKATGYVNFNGTLGDIVVVGSTVSSSDGTGYTTTQSATVVAYDTTAVSVNRDGGLVTVVTSAPHQLATNQKVMIEDAIEAGYNGEYPVSVVNETIFTYNIESVPSTPATGTIHVRAAFAKVPVVATATGYNGNKDNGAKMALGAGGVGYVDYFGLVGGADIETDMRYRSRIILTRSSLEALFDEAQITLTVLRAVPGATRVQVKKIYPVIGAVTVYFVKDNDPVSIIPTPGDVLAARTAILAITPAHTSPADIHVFAPTPVTVNFSIVDLTPDTPELRAAILSNLDAFFREQVDIEESVSSEKYRGIIITTVDPLTGGEVESFSLTSPSGDISVGVGQIAKLGLVSFA